jgi:AcrR family transcriptional regulator
MAVPADASDTRGGVRSQRLAARRAELLEAAVRVIRRQGDAVAMENIAAEAGISRPILYRHFGDATGIYAAVAHQFLAELGERLLQGPADASGRALLHRQVSTFLDFVADDPNVYRFLVRHAPSTSEPGPQRRGFSLLVARQTTGFLQAAGWPAATAQVAAALLVGGLEATADQWLHDPADAPREVAEVAEQVTTVLWDGFRGVAQQVAERPAG